DEQWRQELTPLQYSVLRQAHTERPFTGEDVLVVVDVLTGERPLSGRLTQDAVLQRGQLGCPVRLGHRGAPLPPARRPPGRPGGGRCTATGSARMPSSTRAPGGPASTSPRSPRRSSCGRTTACSCGAPRSSAGVAAGTWGTSSTTAPPRPATGTASTRARWRS